MAGSRPVPTVYVSASPRDQRDVDSLARHLASAGARVLHRGVFEAGRLISSEVEQAMREADVIVLLLSMDLLLDNDNEIDLALAQRGRGARVIPVLLRPALLPPELTELHPLPSSDMLEVAEATLQPLVQDVPASPQVEERHDALFAVLGGDVGRRLSEYDGVKQRLQLAGLGRLRSLKLIQRASIQDVVDAVIRHRPGLVHLGGSGSPRALRELLSYASMLQRGQVRCVLLDPSGPEWQTQELADALGCVVSVPASLASGERLAFLSGFYSALAAGQPVSAAVEVGQVLIELEGPRPAEAPRLLHRGDVDPRQVRLRTT